MKYCHVSLKFYLTLILLLLISPSFHLLAFADTRNFDTYNEFYQGGSGALSSQAKVNTSDSPDEAPSGFISLKENLTAPKISSWEEYPEFSKNVESEDFGSGVS